MLFRRTCKLVDMKTARKNAEKAKPLKKAVVSLLLYDQQVSVLCNC